MKGLHLTADLRGCQGNLAAMVEPAAMRRLCLAAVETAGLTPVGELFHPFPAPGGVTGVVLLAESHLTVHAWPEHQAVTLDVYVCNVGTDNSARAEQVVAHLVDAFEPRGVERQRLQRGAVVTRGWRRSTA